MTESECTALIKTKLREIVEIAAEYMEREPNYLSLTWQSDYKGYISVNNLYYGADEDKPINASWFGVGDESEVQND